MGFFWIFYKFSVLAWFLLKHKRQITGHTSHAIFKKGWGYKIWPDR